MALRLVLTSTKCCTLLLPRFLMMLVVLVLLLKGITQVPCRNIPYLILWKSKHEACTQKVSEVEEIVKKLKNKHWPVYLVEKLNTWAHMLHLEKHDSLDVPQNVPYFTRGQKSVSQPPPSAPVPVTAPTSPIESVWVWGQNAWNSWTNGTVCLKNRLLHRIIMIKSSKLFWRILWVS